MGGRRASIIALGLALTAVACGSDLSQQRLEQANSPFTSTAGSSTAAATGSSQSSASGSTSAGGTGEAASSSGAASTGGASSAGGGASTGSRTGTGSAGASAGGSVAGGSRRELVFGTFGTASGPIGAQLLTIPVADRAWIADVNARGGLNGHPVRVIFGGDDGSDPGRALSIVRRLVEQDHVLALWGTYGGVTGASVIPYLEQKKVPLIGGVGGSQTEDTSPMMFQPQVGATLAYNRGIPTAVRTLSNATKMAFLYCREAAVCTGGAKVVQDYAPKVGMKIVYTAQVSLAQPDFTAEVLAARNAGAEVVGGIIDVSGFVRIIRSAHRQGWRPFFACSVSCNEEAIKAGGSDVEGMFALSSVAPYSASPKMGDYVAAVNKYVPGGLVGGTGGGAWAQGKLLEAIAPKLGDNPTSQDILDALWSLRGVTLGGIVPPLTFPRGSHERVNMCPVPLKFQGGKFTAPLGEGVFVCGFDDGFKKVTAGG